MNIFKAFMLFLAVITVCFMILSCDCTNNSGKSSVTSAAAVTNDTNNEVKIPKKPSFAYNVADSAEIKLTHDEKNILLVVDAEHLYGKTPEDIDSSSTTKELDEIGFVRFAKNDIQSFSSSNFTVTARKDTFMAYVKLMNAFARAYGSTGNFILTSGYLAATDSETVTGNVIAFKIKAENGLYPFNAYSKTLKLENGETVTWQKWFSMNCAKYGFVYYGTDETESGVFRYTGFVNAPYMQENGLKVDMYVNAVKESLDNGITVKDIDGASWTVKYIKENTENGNETKISVNVGDIYEYSYTGDGYIYAVRNK